MEKITITRRELIRQIPADLSEHDRTVSLLNALSERLPENTEKEDVDLQSGDFADGGLFAVSRIDTAFAKRGEMLFLSPGALNFEPMGIDTAEFIRWALESREETLKGVWLTGEILSPRALKKHITAKLDLLDRLDMLKTEGDA